jgi:uncharacterized protein (DUF58 family)
MALGRFLGREPGTPGLHHPPSPAQRPFLRLPRSLKVTRQGKWYIGVLFLIGIAAINTGNNLLYLVEGMLLSLIIISGIMSENTLRRVRVERVLPAHARAGSETQVRLVASNDKKLLPSLSFKIVEAGAPGLKASGAYILKLGKGQNLSKTRRYVFERRGMATLHAVIIETAFPFGLFVKGRRIELPAEIVVYPRIRKISDRELEVEGFRGGDEGARKKGHGAELYGLREHLAGEDARHVDWKASARASTLLHREYEAESEQGFMVVFDNYSAGPGGDAAFEKAVEEAASIASCLFERGARVGLKTLSCEVPCASGRGQMDKIMTTLSLIGPAGSAGALKVCVKSI